jgi:hypothetical protein
MEKRMPEQIAQLTCDALLRAIGGFPGFVRTAFSAEDAFGHAQSIGQAVRSSRTAGGL